ncbi:MAG: sodium:solute symporter family protein [Verrucomicrobiota bacterium]
MAQSLAGWVADTSIPERGAIGVDSRQGDSQAELEMTRNSWLDAGQWLATSDTAIALHGVDIAILLIYVLVVVAIGFALKRHMKSSADFLTSGRSIPAWVTGLAFMSANLGALELVGMTACGAKYGMATCHFYWVGAIAAMVFLAVFMMPFYYGSKARSVPEYLKLRFDERVRCLNSITFAVMTVFASGISMNALAKLLHQLLGWDYSVSLWLCSVVVLIYVLKGGLTSAIYTEVLQFFMIVLGFSPVVYLGMRDIGGWPRLKEILGHVAQNPSSIGLKPEGVHYAANAWTSVWAPLLGGGQANPMGVDWFAMFFGLGFVLAFGYWCTNFLVIQRAMAARNMTAARNTPLIAAVPKMFLPLLVILPGMLAAGLAYRAKDADNGYRLPPKAIEPAAYATMLPVVKHAAANNLTAPAALAAINQALGSAANDLKLSEEKIGKLVAAVAANPALPAAAMETSLQNAVKETDFDGVILSLVKRYCPPGMLGLALTALLASFMSGMAGNVTAFNTVWTYDLYQAYIAPDRSDAHYMWMGRCVTVVGILLSIACAYFAANFNNAMDICQLVFSFVNAPLFATFLLGMFWARTTGTGAFYGLLGGTATSALFHGMTLAEGNIPGVKGGYFGVQHTFPSEMAQNFWLATFAFTICLALTAVLSLATRRTKTDEELKGLVYSMTPRLVVENQPFYQRPAVLGGVLFAICIVLNIIFW